MTADLKNVTQADNGQYFHKAVFYDRDQNATIGTTPIFNEPGGCWSCVTEIHFENTKYVLDGMHDKFKVLVYLEAF